MGGSSSSNSSSSNQTTTNQYDQRVAVEAEGIGIGSGATVTITDGGIIEGAGELAKSFNETLQHGYDSLDGIVGEVGNLALQVVRENNAILAEQSEADTKELAETTIKFGLVATTAIVAAMFIFKR